MSGHKCPNRLKQARIDFPGCLQHFGHPITGWLACLNRPKAHENCPATTDTSDTFNTTETSMQSELL